MPNFLYLRRVSSGSNQGDSILTNPAANHFYYNALVVANGGVENFHTYYGVSIETFKTAINTAFTSLDTTGLTSKIKRWTPRLGNIADTQSVNAINPGTYDGSFSGGVSFSTAGVIFDGINGYESTAYAQNQWGATAINVGLSFNLVANSLAGTVTVLGANSGGTFTEVRYIPAFGPRLYNYVGIPDFADFLSLENKFHTYCRSTTTNTTYQDGVLVNNTTSFGINGLGSSEMFIGAMNDGGATRFSSITTRNEVFHELLNDTEAQNLYNILTAFDTALGR